MYVVYVFFYKIVTDRQVY